MTRAIVLSGGGSRGDFQLGALTALYEAGLKPDIVCGTSVGALNAIMLTQGDAGLEDLRKIWFGLRRNDHMWTLEDWWQEVHPELRKAILDAMHGDAAVSGDPATTGAAVGGGVGLLLLGPFGILTGALIGAAVAGALVKIGTVDAVNELLLLLDSRARALFNINPVRREMAQRFDPAKLAQFVAAGKKLRLATVGLESGELCYVTETGALLSRNGTQQLATGISVMDGAMASSSIAAVFPPVNFAGDAWVDGGHRENVPLRAAIQAGATEIYAICASPSDRWSAVNRTQDGLSRPTDFETRKIMAIAERALLTIHLDELAADDVYPVMDAANIPITLIAPEYPSHDILTIDPELVRVNYDYGYRCAWDAINNAPPALKDLSSQIALKHARASRLRKVAWNGIGVPFAAEIVPLMADAAAAMAARAAQGARNAGPAVPQAFSQGSDMRPGELMLPGQSLASPDGQFQLVYQADGNLVIYRTGGGATWASNTGGTSAGVCVLQRDGNLVVYDAARVPRWASGTNGHQDIGLRLQTDGNLVLHRDGQVIWQTGATAPAAVRPVIVRNTSPTSVTVRFYHVNDTVKLATLPDGVRTIPPGGTVNWTLPAGFQEVKVTFNGRNDKTVVAGQTVTFETDERVRILNRSPRAISVRIYLETDIVRLVTLPGGDLSVPPGGEVTWEMPQDIETAMVIMNNRTREVAIRGKTLTYAQDDRILVKNLSPRVARAQFYNVRDTVLWVTLPGGDLRVPPNGDAFFTVPSNLSAVQVRVGGQRVVADTGAVLNVQADGTVTTG